MDIKDVKELGHWQIAIAAAGVAITLAAIAAGAKPMVLAGLGMIAFGVGEMCNHPYQERWVFDDYGHPTAKISGHPWNPSTRGVALDIIGVLMFFGGLGWFILA